MTSRISKAFTQKSLRTGMPICNHGMVPVYHPRGGGFGCGYNNSILGPDNFYMRPMDFCYSNSLFGAGFMPNLRMDWCDWNMNWDNRIPNWCGGGSGQQTTPTDPDLTLLQNTLKDTNDLDYEVVKNSDGSYSVTVTDKKHPGNNKYISGTKESILRELGYTNGSSRTSTSTETTGTTVKPETTTSTEATGTTEKPETTTSTDATGTTEKSETTTSTEATGTTEKSETTTSTEATGTTEKPETTTSTEATGTTVKPETYTSTGATGTTEKTETSTQTEPIETTDKTETSTSTEATGTTDKTETSTTPRYKIGQQKRKSHTRVKIMHGCGPYQYAQLYRHSDGSPLSHTERMELVDKFGKNGTNPMLKEGKDAMHVETTIKLDSGKEVSLTADLENERQRIEDATLKKDRNKPGVPDREFVIYSDNATQQWYLIDNNEPDGKKIFPTREKLDEYLVEIKAEAKDIAQEDT